VLSGFALQPSRLISCPAAALAPARIAVSSDELILLSASNDERVKVIWPSGWAAWRVAGRAELVSATAPSSGTRVT
jgi:hypothetical protein